MSAIFAVFYRDLRQRINNVGFMFWDVFAPVAYLLLFGTGFERAMGGGFNVNGLAVDYTSFLLPGVLSMTAFTIAMNTSWTFFMDKDSGIFYELLTYPITRRQFLIGKVSFNVLLSAFGALLTITVGVLLMGIKVQWWLLPATLGAVILTTAGWFFMFSVISIQMNRMDDFNTITSVSYILFMFLSSLFYPIDDLPTVFRVAAYFNPMTWQTDILRYCLLGIGQTSLILIETLAFSVFALICLAFAVRTMERAG